jgi:nitrate reductase beta subunit
VQAEACRKGGDPSRRIAAAQRRSVYDLAVRHRVALPLHPEYRTLPMVWYIPPLSPVADVVHAAGYDPGDPDQVFATIDSLRIPIEYLANLFTAGEADTVRAVLRKLAVVRAIMRAGQLGLNLDENLPASVGASVEDLEDSPPLAIASTRTVTLSRLRTPRTPVPDSRAQLFCSRHRRWARHGRASRTASRAISQPLPSGRTIASGFG